MSWMSTDCNDFINNLSYILRNSEWKDEDKKKFTVDNVWLDNNEAVVELRNGKECRQEWIMVWAGNDVLRTYDPEYGIITDWKPC